MRDEPPYALINGLVDRGGEATRVVSGL
jgi:hypothetical protein